MDVMEWVVLVIKISYISSISCIIHTLNESRSLILRTYIFNSDSTSQVLHVIVYWPN